MGLTSGVSKRSNSLAKQDCCLLVGRLQRQARTLTLAVGRTVKKMLADVIIVALRSRKSTRNGGNMTLAHLCRLVLMSCKRSMNSMQFTCRAHGRLKDLATDQLGPCCTRRQIIAPRHGVPEGPPTSLCLICLIRLNRRQLRKSHTPSLSILGTSVLAQTETFCATTLDPRTNVRGSAMILVRSARVSFASTRETLRASVFSGAASSRNHFRIMPHRAIASRGCFRQVEV